MAINHRTPSNTFDEIGDEYTQPVFRLTRSSPIGKGLHRADEYIGR
jgi:hypothetical protein